MELRNEWPNPLAGAIAGRTLKVNEMKQVDVNHNSGFARLGGR